MGRQGAGRELSMSQPQASSCKRALLCRSPTIAIFLGFRPHLQSPHGTRLIRLCTGGRWWSSRASSSSACCSNVSRQTISAESCPATTALSASPSSASLRSRCNLQCACGGEAIPAGAEPVSRGRASLALFRLVYTTTRSHSLAEEAAAATHAAGRSEPVGPWRSR